MGKRGPKHDKLITDLARIVGNEKDPITKFRKLRKVVDSWYQKACDGSFPHLKELLDRLEGPVIRDSTNVSVYGGGEGDAESAGITVRFVKPQQNE